MGAGAGPRGCRVVGVAGHDTRDAAWGLAALGLRLRRRLRLREGW